jgi:methionyl-tRNA synthetase
MRYLVTAALPYANGPIHLGHLAGCYLPADVFVRWLKARGEEVLLICGTDEHGVAIELRARKEGCTPTELVDRYYAQIKKSFDDFGIEFTHFSRTSRPIHHETASKFFLSLYEKGVFEERVTEQFYDEEAGQFLADRYILGVCPRCSYDQAYGDQCERCGSSLSPEELIEPRSALSGATPVRRSTRNWFLPMDKLAEGKVFRAYAERVSHWRTHVRGQFNSWINQGLMARSMTRDLNWGIPVPLKDAESKVLYVWFDAPIGYISATREYFQLNGGASNEDAWKTWWQSPDTQLVHFIGKDNIVFHTIIFPMILAEQGSYVLPTQVPANEFLNLEGEKISTSRNHAIWLHEYLVDLPGRQDELRYVLTAIAPESKDSDFTWLDYQARVNNELVAILGNFVNRVMVPDAAAMDALPPELQSALEACWFEIDSARAELYALLSEYRLREAQAAMMRLARAGNKFLAETEPWKRVKEDPRTASGILYVGLQVCAHLAVACAPFLPSTAQKISGQLGWTVRTAESDRNWWADCAGVSNHRARHNPHLLAAEQVLGASAHLFTPITDEQLQPLRDRLMRSSTPVSHTTEASAQFSMKESNKEKQESNKEYKESNKEYKENNKEYKENNKEYKENNKEKKESNMEMDEKQFVPLKSEVAYPDFEKLDLRVAQIKSAERVEGADKLLKLCIDLGFEQRVVVSGIAQHFDPEALVGLKVVLLANLAPRKIRGQMSQGMILLAENADGRLVFAKPDEDAEPGAVIR